MSQYPLRIRSAIVVALLVPLLMPLAARAADRSEHADAAVAQALDQLATGDSKAAHRTLRKATKRHDDAVASLLRGLVGAYQSGDIGRTLLSLRHAESQAEEVSKEDFAALLGNVRDRLADPAVQPTTPLRELWCHLWTLHPDGPGWEDEDLATVGDQLQQPPRPRFTPNVPPSEFRAKGTAIASSVIDVNGCVVRLALTHADTEELGQVALDVMRWWTFEPAWNQGERTAIDYNLTISVTLE